MDVPNNPGFKKLTVQAILPTLFFYIKTSFFQLRLNVQYQGFEAYIFLFLTSKTCVVE